LLLDLPVLKKGSFYYIKDGDSDFIMEDKTKRGLTIKETSIDEKLNVKADKRFEIHYIFTGCKIVYLE
jgi:hypothetical protein